MDFDKTWHPSGQRFVIKAPGSVQQTKNNLPYNNLWHVLQKQGVLIAKDPQQHIEDVLAINIELDKEARQYFKSCAVALPEDITNSLIFSMNLNTSMLRS